MERRVRVVSDGRVGGGQRLLVVLDEWRDGCVL